MMTSNMSDKEEEERAAMILSGGDSQALPKEGAGNIFVPVEQTEYSGDDVTESEMSFRSTSPEIAVIDSNTEAPEIGFVSIGTTEASHIVTEQMLTEDSRRTKACQTDITDSWVASSNKTISKTREISIQSISSTPQNGLEKSSQTDSQDLDQVMVLVGDKIVTDSTTQPDAPGGEYEDFEVIEVVKSLSEDKLHQFLACCILSEIQQNDGTAWPELLEAMRLENQALEDDIREGRIPEESVPRVFRPCDFDPEPVFVGERQNLVKVDVNGSDCVGHDSEEFDTDWVIVCPEDCMPDVLAKLYLAHGGQISKSVKFEDAHRVADDDTPQGFQDQVGAQESESDRRADREVESIMAYATGLHQGRDWKPLLGPRDCTDTPQVQDDRSGCSVANLEETLIPCGDEKLHRPFEQDKHSLLNDSNDGDVEDTYSQTDESDHGYAKEHFPPNLRDPASKWSKAAIYREALFEEYRKVTEKPKKSHKTTQDKRLTKRLKRSAGMGDMEAAARLISSDFQVATDIHDLGQGPEVVMHIPFVRYRELVAIEGNKMAEERSMFWRHQRDDLDKKLTNYIVQSFHLKAAIDRKDKLVRQKIAEVAERDQRIIELQKEIDVLREAKRRKNQRHKQLKRSNKQEGSSA